MKNIREQILDELVKAACRKGSESSRKFLEIVLDSLDKKTIRSKRGIYYDSVNTFRSQSTVDRLIKKYMRILGCSMAALNIRSSPKGLFWGEVRIIYKNGLVIDYVGKNLVPDMEEVESVIIKSKKVLVIEKDTVFERVIDNSILVVCGKGYPCTNTLLLLEKIEASMYCMTDLDPHGLHIFEVYRRRIPSIVRIGLCQDDLFRFKLDQKQCVENSKYDLKLLKKLVLTDQSIEAIFLEGLGMKIELEMLVNKPNFEILEYLKLFEERSEKL